MPVDELFQDIERLNRLREICVSHIDKTVSHAKTFEEIKPGCVQILEREMLSKNKFVKINGATSVKYKVISTESVVVVVNKESNHSLIFGGHNTEIVSVDFVGVHDELSVLVVLSQGKILVFNLDEPGDRYPLLKIKANYDYVSNVFVDLTTKIVSHQQ